MDVGIRELKSHLSEYVERAARGEVIRVTDRGVPRAVLMPVPAVDRIETGIAEGWVARASPRQPGPLRPIVPPPGPTTNELLERDRGE